MKKCFSRMQTLKSGDDCDKFFKSVSYETLVGGTATTGTDIKQNQRFSEGSADKPLSAVGTLTSLLCNSAKVMEKWLQISPVLRLVKIIILISVLSVGMVGESQATEIPTSGTCNSAGTCLWNLSSDGTMTISAAINPNTGKLYENVHIGNYLYDDGTRIGNRPWEENIANIKHLIVGNNITSIGENAFDSAKNLETVTGMKDVVAITKDAFALANNLYSVEMPNVKNIGPWAFIGTKLTSVDMPKVTSIGIKAFRGATALQYVGLPVDENGNPLNVNIADNAFSGANAAVINCSNTNRSACGSCGNDYVKRGVGCVADCGSGYLGKEGRCIDSSLGCGAGYRQFENFCNRIQYTPVEAAKVLKNDNTNEVTITFRN